MVNVILMGQCRLRAFYCMLFTLNCGLVSQMKSGLDCKILLKKFMILLVLRSNFSLTSLHKFFKWQ